LAYQGLLSDPAVDNIISVANAAVEYGRADRSASNALPNYSRQTHLILSSIMLRYLHFNLETAV
jgi:hypothetical protein